MTDQHPLTDEICEELLPDFIVRPLHTDDITAMRVATDWQLEQVIEWLKEKEYDQYHYNKIIYADDLRKAMRPTTTQEEN
jgi:hypothetical protein